MRSKEYLEKQGFGLKAQSISEAGAIKSYNALKIFMKKILLPHCQNNKALIITEGLQCCSLTKTIGEIANDIFLQSGYDELPFYLICIASESVVSYCSLDKHQSFAYALKNASEVWQFNDKTEIKLKCKRLVEGLHSKDGQFYDENSNTKGADDLSNGHSHYIIINDIECCESDHINDT